VSRRCSNTTPRWGFALGSLGRRRDRRHRPRRPKCFAFTLESTPPSWFLANCQIMQPPPGSCAHRVPPAQGTPWRKRLNLTHSPPTDTQSPGSAGYCGLPRRFRSAAQLIYLPGSSRKRSGLLSLSPHRRAGHRQKPPGRGLRLREERPRRHSVHHRPRRRWRINGYQPTTPPHGRPFTRSLRDALRATARTTAPGQYSLRTAMQGKGTGGSARRWVSTL
jgi:hypothetical protein